MFSFLRLFALSTKHYNRIWEYGSKGLEEFLVILLNDTLNTLNTLISATLPK